MRRHGVEDVKGKMPFVSQPPVSEPPKPQPPRKLSKGEHRQQKAAAFFSVARGSNIQKKQLATTTQQALQISSFSLIAPLAIGLALSGCTTGTSEAPSSTAGVGIGQRDLTPEEKQVIMDAVAPALRNPASAKYHCKSKAHCPAADVCFWG
jgi:hypothetical protein